MVNIWPIIDQLFNTAECWLCQAPAEDATGLCHPCYQELAHIKAACPVCAQPLPALGHVCGQCLSQPPAYDSAHIPYIYGAPLDRLISQFKFQHNLAAGRLLAGLWLRSLPASALPQADCIIPVPLHPRRLRHRGYNQALELARPIAATLQLPIAHSLCVRNKATRVQSELALKERKKNLRHAFSVRQNHNYKHIVIIDDVVTSGNTVNELARTLKLSGVETVQVWAVARAVLHR